jgi:biofilm PGA synthesis lipoprotein PgaB
MRSFTIFGAAALLVLLLPLMTAPARAAVVLQYHHISDTTPAITSTSPERFVMHLDYLASQDFAVVPLQVLVDALVSKAPLPDRTVAITFDDGYRSIYETAFPLLKARGWPFTVFINPEPHDRRHSHFMSWEQLRELSRNGGTIANHTVSHPHLLERTEGQDAAAWRDWVTAEIVEAQQRIAEEIGSAAKLFAYPFGEFDGALLDVVASLGYAGFGQQSGPLGPYSDLRVLPRFPFGGSYGDREDFATKVNSLPMPVASADSIRLESDDGLPLQDIVLAGFAARPVLALQFVENFDTAGLNCFVSGQGRALLAEKPPWVRVQAERPLSPGRSRYNCTAPSGQPGRYFWFSQLWIIQ